MHRHVFTTIKLHGCLLGSALKSFRNLRSHTIRMTCLNLLLILCMYWLTLPFNKNYFSSQCQYIFLPNIYVYLRFISIVISLQAVQLGFDSQQGQRREFFSSPPCPDWPWGPLNPYTGVRRCSWGEVVRAWSWPLPPITGKLKNMLSWHAAWLSTRTTLPLTYHNLAPTL
jgi:hypothetical protein